MRIYMASIYQLTGKEIFTVLYTQITTLSTLVCIQIQSLVSLLV